MLGIRFKARSGWRGLIVWALLPFVVFNNRATHGCDCCRFGTTCHCQSGSFSGASCSHGYARGCCERRDHCHTDARPTNVMSVEKSVACHSNACNCASNHEIVPATVGSLYASNDLSCSAFNLSDIDLPEATSQRTLGTVASGQSLPPPADLVIQLRRLVI